MDRPIIFSAPMIRALLRGEKTQTRRLLRQPMPATPGMEVHPNHQAKHPAPYFDAYCGLPATRLNPRGMSDYWCWWTRDDREGLGVRVGYAPGDRLWVREAWSHTGSGVWSTHHAMMARDGRFVYRADDDGSDPGMKWFPSIHMPRPASRLTLLVSQVRVQRLQAITEEDALAEGVTRIREGCHVIRDFGYDKSELCHTSAVTPFSFLWDHLHGEGAWNTDPWVVALTFELVQQNIGLLAQIDPPIPSRAATAAPASTGTDPL